jgi:hypothetical protein
MAVASQISALSPTQLQAFIGAIKQVSGSLVKKIPITQLRPVAAGLINAMIREGGKGNASSVGALAQKLESMPGVAQILRPLVAGAAKLPTGATTTPQPKQVPTTFGPPSPGASMPFIPPPAETIMGMPKMVVYIGGGLGIAAVLFFALKKKK